MTIYEVNVTFDIEAESKIEASDKLRALLDESVEVQLVSDVDTELFAELGVHYE
jgi:hypothetical protein